MSEEKKENNVEKIIGQELNKNKEKANLKIAFSFEKNDYLFNQDVLFEISNQLDKLNNMLELRNSFKELFLILPDLVIFSPLIEKWYEWELVLLLLFTNHPYKTKREYIWNHNIKQVNLRNIIKDKKEFINVIDEDNLILNNSGLKYIIDKLNQELKNIK